MQSQGTLTDSQEFAFLDPEDFAHLSSDPNISTMMDNYPALMHDKPMKTEVPPSYEDSIQYPLHNPMLMYHPNAPKTYDTQQIPSKEEFAGQYHFAVELVTHPQGKNWVYSPSLQKVFIDIEQALPLRFKWVPYNQDNLLLRATMVFSHDQYRNEPVVRCHNHMAAENKHNTTVDSNLLKHVIRCMSNSSSIYEENASGHLSVRSRLGVPQAGCDYVQLNFQFYCKNSCNSGMNRRPTEVVFTLEDEDANVFGRRRLLVRVCSCPKRDKEKEESEDSRKTQIKGGKKRKIAEFKNANPNLDMTPCKLSIEVPGKELKRRILQCAYDVIAGESVRQDRQESYRPYLDDIARKIQMH